LEERRVLSSYFSIGWRAWRRQAVISFAAVAGLVVAFTAALLIAASVHDDLSYDTSASGHEDVYLMVGSVAMPGRDALYLQRTPLELAPRLKEDLPSIKAVARIRPMPIAVRNGAVEGNEQIYWADPDLFEVLPLPTIAGNLNEALRRPDGVVVSQRLARKYFGREDVVGARIELDRQNVVTVMAVIEDLPPNSHLKTDLFGSSLAQISSIYQADQRPPSTRFWFATGYTYVRLHAGESIAKIEQAMPAFLKRQKPQMNDDGTAIDVRFVPLADIHLTPYAGGLKAGSDLQSVVTLGVIGTLIVLLASVNFMSLTAIRAVQRTREVAVRRILGASRRDLAVQFIGEAFGMSFVCVLAAVLLAATLLPTLNTLLGRELSIAVFRRPQLIAVVILLPTIVSLVAGSYPTLVVARLRPAVTLKGNVLQPADRGTVRQLLVAINFALLIGLIVMTGTMYQQVRFALGEGLRVDLDQVLLIESNCRGPIKEEIKALPGVKGVTCSWLNGVVSGPVSAPYKNRDGQDVVLSSAPVDFGYFELYGIEPFAGRLFSERFADAIPEDPAAAMEAPVVVNRSAARLLGYATPEAAVGEHVLVPGIKRETKPSEIIGVVPDFAFESIRSERLPMIYYVRTDALAWLHVRLDGTKMPETLRAIDGIWNRVGTTQRPISRFFLDKAVQELYLDITHQTRALGISAIVAVAIACLGLFGLVSYVVERRTKEIAIRKIFGAQRRNVFGLMLWQFMKPVVLATTVAWVGAYIAASQWLQRFAYHTDLDPRLFVLAAALAAVIALLVVITHIAKITSAHPVWLQRRVE
jgi:putative ABC transport system permease protein